MQLNHTVAKMSALLWSDGGQPEMWKKGWVPQSPVTAPTTPVIADLQQAITEHPSLVAYRYQKEQLAIERRWKKEQFKQELTFNYNFLANQFDFNPESTDGISNLVSYNYK